MYQRLAFRFYWWAEKLITPTLRSSQYEYYETLKGSLRNGARWLDLGCGHQVFGSWMEKEQAEVVSRSKAVVGLDRDWQGLRNHSGIQKKVCGDLLTLPMQTASLDLVTANMVMEHVANPGRLLAEVHRVLAPGGRFIFHTPNYFHWGTRVAAAIPQSVKTKLIGLLEGRKEQDVFPTHYRLNTPAEIRHSASKSGFKVVELKLVSSSAALIMLGPIVLLELAFIRLLDAPRFAALRSNLVVVLQKGSNQGR